MAVGKNKGLAKGGGGKKGSKKKIVDPFTKKDWYNVKAPSVFKVRDIGKTLVNRTVGTKIASEGLKGRVFEVSISDLQDDNDADRAFRKFRLIAESVQGNHVLTNFHGMTLTTEKLRSMVKKWQTLIEANVDVKTTDGYLLRVFCIGYTQKNENSKRKASYAQHAQVKAIRKAMITRITKEVSQCDLKELVKKLVPESDFLAKDFEKACRSIFPLHGVQIRKVKVLKKPRFSMAHLMEMHSGDDFDVGGAGEIGGEDIGEGVNKPDNYEPPVLESV